MSELTLFLILGAWSLVYLVGYYWLQSKIEKLTIENNLLKELVNHREGV